MGKIEEAIKKINDEVQKNHSNTYLVMVGEHIIDCITTEKAAEKILTEKKNLNGCLQSITSKAARHKTGKVAVIDDVTVYGWAREYFGLTEAAEEKPHLELVKTQPPASEPAFPQTDAEEHKKSKHLSMDDFF